MAQLSRRHPGRPETKSRKEVWHPRWRSRFPERHQPFPKGSVGLPGLSESPAHRDVYVGGGQGGILEIVSVPQIPPGSGGRAAGHSHTASCPHQGPGVHALCPVETRSPGTRVGWRREPRTGARAGAPTCAVRCSQGPRGGCCQRPAWAAGRGTAGGIGGGDGVGLHSQPPRPQLGHPHSTSTGGLENPRPSGERVPDFRMAGFSKRKVGKARGRRMFVPCHHAVVRNRTQTWTGETPPPTGGDVACAAQHRFMPGEEPQTRVDWARLWQGPGQWAGTPPWHSPREAPGGPAAARPSNPRAARPPPPHTHLGERAQPCFSPGTAETDVGRVPS